ncbi:hypothetical protein AB4Z54_02675 [Streptomyces sp. MCAF7]
MALAAWGLADEAETAALIMSELVANAARHARGHTIRMTVNRPADNRVYVAVIDRGKAKFTAAWMGRHEFPAGSWGRGRPPGGSHQVTTAGLVP